MQALYSDSDTPAVVEVISGACLMVRRDVFENVGMFSTDYFMYTEDIDLCYKIRTAGYKAYYVRGARVVHHGGKSSEHHEGKLHKRCDDERFGLAVHQEKPRSGSR